MLTEREREALARMKERMVLGYSDTWRWRASGPGPHVMLPYERPKRSAWRKAACGWVIGPPERTEEVPRSDLRLGFIRDLCPACRKALGLEG